MIWAATFAIHLILKQENEITIKQHYSLFSDGEPHIDNTQSYQMHTYQLTEKLGWIDPHGKEPMSQQ